MGCCNDPATALTGTPPDPSQHVNYARGMVLGVDDFTQEFAYLAGRDQWMARDAIGYGTLSGLRVSAEVDGTDGPRLHVSAGSALVQGGQLVCVPSDQCAVINKWLAKPDNAAIANRLLNPTSPPVSPPMTPPAVTTGVIALYLVLCYRDCRTRPVPIPGEPCRSEDELMAPSRVADEFRLELRERAPVQVEEDALRDFVRWLRTNVQVSAGGSPSFGDVASWLNAMRPVAHPWLDAARSSPPPAANETFERLGDYLFSLSPADLVVGADQISDFLRVAFRFWVTELRPLWMARRCHRVMLEDQDCVLLARVEFEVVWAGGSPTGAWQIAGSPAVVTVDETTRPFLTHQRLLQEWMLCGWDAGGAGAVFPSPLTSPPAAIFAPDDAQFVIAATDAALPNAQSLGALGSGLLKNTVVAARGTLSQAAAGTDYYAPGGTDVRIADGGTGTSVAPANGQVLIGNAGAYALAALTGTPNRVLVTNGPGSITLSAPQDIAVASVPQFAGLITTGGIRVHVTAVSTSIPLTATHHVLLCTKKITLTLPKCSVTDAGRQYVIKNIGTQPVTLAFTGTDTIDAATPVIAKQTGITIVSDGKDTWHVIAVVP